MYALLVRLPKLFRDPVLFRDAELYDATEFECRSPTVCNLLDFDLFRFVFEVLVATPESGLTPLSGLTAFAAAAECCDLENDRFFIEDVVDCTVTRSYAL